MKRAFGLLGGRSAAYGSKVPLLAVIAIAMIGGFSMTGCASNEGVNRGGWSKYSSVPSRNFVVVGTVEVRNVRRTALLEELMTRAFEMGAHDIINVRIGMARGPFGGRIRLATAVAIQYVHETSWERTARAAAIVDAEVAAHVRGLPYAITVTGNVQEN